MSTYRRATVTGTASWGGDAQEAVLVMDDGSVGKGVAFAALTGTVGEGDEVVVNTTAVDLELGSGGYHFILWNLGRERLDTGGEGHIIKLRYTPLQLNVAAVEEGFGEDWDPRGSIEGMPVVAGELHSQLLPVAAGFRDASPGGKLVYVMTDGGALPASFSRTVAFLKEEGYIDSVITCGHAFGGDLEAVSVYGAIVAARRVCEADAVVTMMGPGIAGTGSRIGFSGIEQAVALNAAGYLGGRPIAVPRITFADARERHRGLSHHTATVLEATQARVIVPVPVMDDEKALAVGRALERAAAGERHELVTVEAGRVLRLIEECGMRPTVMGRGPGEEPEFFMAAGAAGMIAGGGE